MRYGDGTFKPNLPPELQEEWREDFSLEFFQGATAVHKDPKQEAQELKKSSHYVPKKTSEVSE
jgi:hypothetical protein